MARGVEEGAIEIRGGGRRGGGVFLGKVRTRNRRKRKTYILKKGKSLHTEMILWTQYRDGKTRGGNVWPE